MKKILITALLPLAIFASEKSYDGYTYFSVGVENIKYVEDITLSTGEKVHSEAKATSPVYVSGSLVRVDDLFDFSIDLSSTLLPAEIDETWHIDGALAQTDKFDAMINSMQFLGQYKINNNHRVVAGATYKLNTYKRYTFKDENGNILTDSTTNAKLGLIEERVATLYATTGYWYESTAHASPNALRFKFNALLSQSIWNEASNTGFEKVTFNELSAYSLESSGYVGYPVMDGLEVGLFAGYSYQKKPGTDVASDGHTKWPDNTLTLWQGGVSVVWNFSKKEPK